MNLYVEPSAILSWLLDEERAAEVRRLLAEAELIVTSDLTFIECDRVLLRAAALGELTEAEAADRRAHIANVSAYWSTLRIGGEVVDRARQSFPSEPIRTLDAIHLASVLVARAAIAGLAVLSLDDRVRASAQRLGLEVLPQ